MAAITTAGASQLVLFLEPKRRFRILGSRERKAAESANCFAVGTSELGLAQLEFRDELLVLLDGALGTRRGELAALQWQDCDF